MFVSCLSILALYSQVDQERPPENLPPDISLWAWELFSKPRFHWTEARVQALQESCLQTLQAADSKLSVPD